MQTITNNSESSSSFRARQAQLKRRLAVIEGTRWLCWRTEALHLPAPKEPCTHFSRVPQGAKKKETNVLWISCVFSGAVRSPLSAGNCSVLPSCVKHYVSQFYSAIKAAPPPHLPPPSGGLSLVYSRTSRSHAANMLTGQFLQGSLTRGCLLLGDEFS